jgi:hypothetical protein
MGYAESTMLLKKRTSNFYKNCFSKKGEASIKSVWKEKFRNVKKYDLCRRTFFHKDGGTLVLVFL